MTDPTTIKAECRRAIELGEEATAGPWHWVNAETDTPVDFDAADPSIVPDSQETHIGGRLSLRTTWEEGEGWAKLPKFIAENEEGGLKADHQLIAFSRTFSPAAAKALLIAIEALELMVKMSQGERHQYFEYKECQKALGQIAAQWSAKG